MGLDARDCRLDIAFGLCDRMVPDNVTWDWSIRDKSGVWLDFVDAQFSPCRTVDEYGTYITSIEVTPEEGNTSIDYIETSEIMVKPLPNVTSAEGTIIQ